jgi:two-component system chemotaxis sensor kinase CheA
MESTKSFEIAFEEFALSVIDLDDKPAKHLGSLLNRLDSLRKQAGEHALSTAILSRIETHMKALILADIDPVPDPNALYNDIYQQIDILREYLKQPDKQARIAEQWFVSYKTPLIPDDPLPTPTIFNPVEDRKCYEDLSETPATPEDDDTDIFIDFLHEAREYIDTLENELIELEGDPRNKDRINRVFRPFHTLKGVAGFMGLKYLNQVTHETETLLDLARNDKLLIDATVIQGILGALDVLKTIISRLSPDHREEMIDPVRFEGVLAQLRELSNAKQQEFANAPVEFQAQTEQIENHKVQDSRIRIRTEKLDRLIDMVGELVINANLVGQDKNLSAITDPDFINKYAQLSRVVSELQHASMALRMVPVGSVFSRMKRVVADYVHLSGKQISLVIHGEDTEIDRSIVDGIYEPLVHMIRNSCDHAIVSPGERIEAGKPPHGTITLNARHLGNDIVIEVSDDGEGLNRERILARAIERGLARQSESLPDDHVFRFIFEPGFSTVDKVTKVSGRGVGMDVVSAFLKQYGGRIEIDSAIGKGTTFRIRLPLTLAIIQGMLVRVGSELYIIPVVHTLRTLKPTPEQINHIVGQGDTLRLQNRLVPIRRLSEVFKVRNAVENYEDGLLIIVSTSNQQVYGLLVDGLLQIQDVVIKNLGEKFRDLTGISGATILGDGRVGLIVDVNTLLGSS